MYMYNEKYCKKDTIALYHNKRRYRKKPPEFISHVPNTSTVDEVDADADIN